MSEMNHYRNYEELPMHLVEAHVDDGAAPGDNLRHTIRRMHTPQGLRSETFSQLYGLVNYYSFIPETS